MRTLGPNIVSWFGFFEIDEMRNVLLLLDETPKVDGSWHSDGSLAHSREVKLRELA